MITDHPRSPPRCMSWLCGALSLLWPLAAAAQELPKKYALLIGIDAYQYQSSIDISGAGIPALKFARRDAEHLGKRLASQGYITTILENERATRRSIVAELLRFSELAREEDTFLLYYAGHGVKRQKTHEVYWLNYDGDPTRPDIDGLRVRTLIDLVKEIPAKRKLVMLDHCYAGEIEQSQRTQNTPLAPEARAGAPPAPRLVLARDAMPAELKTAIANEPEGMVVFAASRGLAFELSSNQHGVFTAALLTAITTHNADLADGQSAQRDGALSISEITKYLGEEVRKLSMLNSFDQKPVITLPNNNVVELLDWKPLMRNLDPEEIPKAAERYRAQLGRWASQGRIPTQVQSDCEAVLARWQQSPMALSPTDEIIVFLLRQYIDTPPVAEEALIAAGLSERVQYELGGQ